MSEWFLTASVLGFILGTIISVLEEWKKQGLTDTSFFSLTWWTVSSIGLGVSAAVIGFYMLAFVGIFATLVAGYATKLKLHDNRHYFNGLSRSGLMRKRPR